MRLRLKDVVKLGKSSIKLSDVSQSGRYSVFGASGLVGYRESFQNSVDSVAIIKDGAGIGRVFLLPKQSSVLGTMQYLSPNNSIDNVFLFYYLRHLELGSLFTGSTIPHIYFKDYGEKSFPTEDKARQVIIARLLAEIDLSIQKRLSQLNMFDSLVKSRFMRREMVA